MRGLRILVPVKRVIDYAVSFQLYNTLFLNISYSTFAHPAHLEISLYFTGQTTRQPHPDGNRDGRGEAQHEPV